MSFGGAIHAIALVWYFVQSQGGSFENINF